MPAHYVAAFVKPGLFGGPLYLAGAAFLQSVEVLAPYAPFLSNVLLLGVIGFMGREGFKSVTTNVNAVRTELVQLRTDAAAAERQLRADFEVLRDGVRGGHQIVASKVDETRRELTRLTTLCPYFSGEKGGDGEG